MAIIVLWFLTLEYTIKIDTGLPKRIWNKCISSPFRTIFGKMKDIKSAASKTVKKDTESDIISVTSSLPSYRTEELPMYTTNTTHPNLPPLYEEADTTNDQIVTIHQTDASQLEYRNVYREWSFLFILFSIEYKTSALQSNH